VKRRDVIALIGGAATWPLGARAQQAGKLPTIGFLGQNTRSAGSEWVAAFVQRLRELGWTDGRTIAIEYRWGEGREERFAEAAAELVRLKVDVIVVSGTPAVMASKRATSTIPIVFATAGDPVGNHLVDSLARPGGNVTGLSVQSNELAGKRIELLRGRGRSGPAPSRDLGQCRQPFHRVGAGWDVGQFNRWPLFLAHSYPSLRSIEAINLIGD